MGREKTGKKYIYRLYRDFGGRAVAGGNKPDHGIMSQTIDFAGLGKRKSVAGLHKYYPSGIGKAETYGQSGRG